MAQKSEEDRARDKAKNGKKVEKEKRRLETESTREVSTNTSPRNDHPIATATVKQNNKAKKAQRLNQAKVGSQEPQGKQITVI